MFHSLLVLAEHTFSRTWDIRQNYIEETWQRGERTRIIRGDHNIRISPQGHIVSKDTGPLLHDLICHQQETVTESFTQRSSQISGLSAWSRTKIQYPNNPFRRNIHPGKYLTEHMSDKHRRRILDIICSGMQAWIQSKVRPFLEHETVNIPWHRLSDEGMSPFERVRTDRDFRRIIKCRKSDKGISAPYRLFQISSERILNNHGLGHL